MMRLNAQRSGDTRSQTNRRRATRQAPNRAELAFYGPRLAKAVIEPGVFHLGIVPACPEALTGSPARAHSGPGMAVACPSVSKARSFHTNLGLPV